jgi:hypothetical protein
MSSPIANLMLGSAAATNAGRRVLSETGNDGIVKVEFRLIHHHRASSRYKRFNEKVKELFCWRSYQYFSKK